MKNKVSTAGIVLLLAGTLSAAEPAAEAGGLVELKAELQNNLNIVWTCIAAFLVFFMQPGFAMVEAGFTRAKNSVNIIMKNLMDFSIGTLTFFLLGFGLMFGTTNGFFGTSDFMIAGSQGDPASWDWTFLIFQTVFAGTAATIVSGAMAGRTKFRSYMFYSVLICGLIYPISGSWAWGGLANGSGWLENLGSGFTDFAGSSVVHSVGGWLALAGAIVLGPRLGKYGPDGKPKAIPGHNITLAALGVFILWFGWFGFNPGSTTLGDGEIGRVAVTTNLAAATGAIAAMAVVWIVSGKPDASMSLNGALAGLVAITAGCYTVTPLGAIAIGLCAGVIVVFSVYFFDRLKIDDPVGAVSVHGVCGAFGTIACGLFNAEAALGLAETSTGLFYGGGAGKLGVQLVGTAAYFLWAFGIGFLMFSAIKYTVGLRVSRDEELKGLDITEHGNEAYAGFQVFSTT
ncbi:ammonium transporter [Sedimentisphaera salicampi]|uniref:Ammonium transporter n=1 Tax=Sedimentisphaera salicampi TaxID=1941349 RepID=A0A1W6LN28_9BACT|nr:ammonium transporter [Sedimentisphaera salicampi]ARN57156.1 Ammonia transporter [Sedimentisphaera salicampi]OXU14752.1 Ammonia transporter [Sedimentisphaera salicampi]